MKSEPVFSLISHTAAEITKVAINSYLTTKITFANMIGNLLIRSDLEYEIDKETVGVNLGLPPRDEFKERFLDNDRYQNNYYRGFPEKAFLNGVLLRNLRFLLSRPEVKDLTTKDSKTWEPMRGRTPLAFKYPPKEGSLTQLFVDFVKNNPGKTRKEFYDSIGRTYTPGHNSEFFAVINDSGIVKMDRKGRQFVYTLGPNYGPWTRGELARIKIQ